MHLQPQLTHNSGRDEPMDSVNSPATSETVIDTKPETVINTKPETVNNTKKDVGEVSSGVHTAQTDGTGRASPEKHDKYDTAEQTVAPVVKHEHVTKTQHQEVQHVVDRERHQDHFHTTVQPLQDHETKETQHLHKEVETKFREFDLEDEEKTRERLAAEQAQFQNTKTEKAMDQTSSVGQTKVHEHVHHHLHETVQPVIEKGKWESNVLDEFRLLLNADG